jgi:para-nitrobenzyl esterase
LNTLTALVLLANPAIAQAAPTEASIAPGKVRGAEADGVIAWKGIPFAAPPVGANRWREPQPVAKWTGVREATQYGHDCMQTPFPSDAAPLGTEPAEDCLVLNVWRPASMAKKLPVMIWIYGGGFVNGGSSPDVYSGAKFAKQGIVFVSFNYRLGRFGFFAHPALTAAHEGLLGNYGYMDQIAALKWVRANIASFGGDPDNVTVFGESAGGSSALAVLTSPVARGLFNRVTVMSGGGRGGLMPMRKISEDRPGSPSAESIGVNFAASVGVAGNGPETLAALRALPADKVLQGLSMMALFTPQSGPTTYVGGPLDDGTIVTGTTQSLLENGAQQHVPVMIGSTSADIGISFATGMDQIFAPFGTNAARARALYDPANSGDVRSIGAAVARDRGMTEPARYVAGMIARTGQTSYCYRFSYVADSMRTEWKAGAPHASDIPWFFDTIDAKYGEKVTDADRAVAKAANTYLANFAKRGDPNGAGLPGWSRYSDQSRTLMDFTPAGKPVGGSDPWTEQLDLIEAVQAAPAK